MRWLEGRCLRLIGIFTVLVWMPLVLMAGGEAQWVALESDAPITAPEVRLISSDGVHTVLEVTMTGFYQETVEAEGVNYQKLLVTDNLAGKQVGHPDLPVITTLVGLPATGTFSAQVAYGEAETFSGYRVYPVQEPEVDSQPTAEFIINPAAYRQDRMLPEQMAALDGPHIWRDCRVVSLQVTPFQYNPVTGQLDVYRKLRIEVTAVPGAGSNPLEGDHSQVSPMFDNMYRAAIINYDEMNYRVMETDEPAIKYLIITNSAAETYIQPLVDFRHAQGYPVEVRTLATPDFDEPTEFKAYISSLYLSGGLEYVLMVGDAGTGANNVPMYWWNPDGSNGSYSDSWYSCLVPGDDDDHYAEIAIGRIVYDNFTELTHQITKLIDYLRTPDTSTNWAEHTLLVAHQEQYPLKYTLCKNQIAAFSYAIQTAIFDSVYGGNGGTNTDVVNYINNTACGILNYRGHGSATEWWQWGPSGSLTVTHIAQMLNENRLFVHFDVCCDNMDIINHPGDCLAESFMKATYAAIAINGAIIPSYTIPNHDYDKEMYKAVYNEGINNIGYVTNFANVTVLNGHGTLGRSNARTYLWLGDACIDVWTNTPQTLTVNHMPVHMIGMDTYEVDVFVGATPVENAMVCAQNDEVYAVGWTNASGHVTLQFESAPTIPADMNLMVTSHNCLPYEATVTITPPGGAYVTYNSHTLNDASGNNNGLADYGESILLNLTMDNVGVDTAYGVTVTVSTANPYITFTDASEFVGDFPAASSMTLTGGFAFDVAINAPDLEFATIDIVAEDSTDQTWESSFSIQLHATDIGVLSVTVDDAAGGNGNGKLDPGESAYVSVSLSNDGSSGASNITTVLTTDFSYLTVLQGSANLANLAASSSGTLTPDYQLQLASGSPDPAMAMLYFELTADNGLHKYMLYNLSLGGFFDDMEGGQGSWMHTNVEPGFTDQWHLSTEDYNSPTHSWKCGDTGTATYANLLDAALVTPTLNLPPGCKLEFDHWIQAETSGYYPDSAYDGGIIEISLGGGAWMQVVPEGGYNTTIRFTAGGTNPYTGPFPGLPCFSGSIDWAHVTVDLSSYSGDLRIRFRFGSDQSVGMEGWYVDDVNIILESGVSAPTNLTAQQVLDNINLTWNSPGSTGLDELLSYNIFLNSVQIDSLIYVNSYQDDMTGMPGGSYTYHVTAVFDEGESGLSNPATVNYVPGGSLEAIEDLVISRLATNVFLNWSPVTGATQYKIYRSTDPFTGFTEIGTSTAASYLDAGVVGVKYFYQVTATDD